MGLRGCNCASVQSYMFAKGRCDLVSNNQQLVAISTMKYEVGCQQAKKSLHVPCCFLGQANGLISYNRVDVCAYVFAKGSCIFVLNN